MKYHKLGRTDINVSVICLGTMTYGEQNTESDAHKQLNYALEQGVNFIDTAELYAIPVRAETQGLTEKYIGSWLKNRKDRDKIILATKVAGPSGTDWVKHIRNGPRLNQEHINQAIDDSLKRLQTDYVDLYQVHWPSRETNYFGKLGYDYSEDVFHESLQETLQVLSALVDSGKVRHIGLSNETAWGTMKCLQIAENMGLSRIVSVQNPYNLLNRSYEIGLAEIAHREQVGLLAYSPLAFGVLSGKYLNGQRPEGARLSKWEDYFPRYISERALKTTARYVELARQSGVDPAQMALAFVNTRPFLTANIIGATNMTQLKSNIESVDLVLSDELIKEIEAIHMDQPNPCP